MDMFRAFFHKIDEKCCSQLEKNTLLWQCHGYINYHKTPFLGPKIDRKLKKIMCVDLNVCETQPEVNAINAIKLCKAS